MVLLNMTPLEIVGLVAIILISCFALIGIIVAIPLIKLINKVRFLMEKLNESLVPVVEKLNFTVTNLNNEVSSISDLTQSIGSIVEQLEKIVKLARILITSPIIKLIGAATGLVGGIKEAAAKKESKEDK